MPKCIISYSYKEPYKTLANDICEYMMDELNWNQSDFWRDEFETGVNPNWKNIYENAQKNAQIAIFFLSVPWLRSKNCTGEFQSFMKNCHHRVRSVFVVVDIDVLYEPNFQHIFNYCAQTSGQQAMAKGKVGESVTFFLKDVIGKNKQLPPWLSTVCYQGYVLPMMGPMAMMGMMGMMGPMGVPQQMTVEEFDKHRLHFFRNHPMVKQMVRNSGSKSRKLVYDYTINGLTEFVVDFVNSDI
eukprot:Colp12_sorted_trinity150504_noHs@5775